MAATQADTDPSAVERAEEALVFIPAFGERTDQSADGVARRIRTALQRQSEGAGVAYGTSVQARQERYGLQDEHTTSVHTVLRVADGASTPFIDVYDMGYAVEQTARFERSSTLARSLRVLFQVSIGIGPLLAAFRRKRKGKQVAAKVQVLIGVIIIFLLAVYAGLLIAGLVDTVIRYVHPTVQTAGRPRDTQRTMGWLQLVAVALAAAGLASPAALKTAFAEAAIDYIGVLAYLQDGTGRDQRVGQLSDLLAHIGPKGYARVHVVGYSFGSIIAFDSFFPPDCAPTRAFATVDTLVTIGCPYDLIRVYWPRYFVDRRQSPGAPDRWVNVFSPIDVMSSSLHDENDRAEAPADRAAWADLPTGSLTNLRYTTGMPGDKLTVLKALLLLGLRAHSMYWVRDGYEGDVGCFGLIAAELWPPSSP